MCSVPVTFGGGSWMQKGAAFGSIEGLNSPFDSQYAYHLASIARGSKVLASCMKEAIDRWSRKAVNYSGHASCTSAKRGARGENLDSATLRRQPLPRR